ncbi:serine-rich adhesin for platelets-like isoform X1 [Macrobrachium rosenbergii]|uniref:serine-rich adhesin for platelets-like isoform X1 n=2 Tax=Macrobrachium rosenbergii TaxID=79674 RepID=UPI0034D7A637
MASMVLKEGGGGVKMTSCEGKGSGKGRGAKDFEIGPPKKDPYTEIENYLRKAQEEISAVFGEGGVAVTSKDDRSRPRAPARPPLLDGQASPSKIRKVYTTNRPVETPPPPPPQRQLSIPASHSRKRVPLTRKSRRVSAPTLINAQSSQNGHSSSSSSSSSSADPWCPRRDPHIHEWAQGLLKDFHSLVEEEIRSLGKNTSTTASTPCLAPSGIADRSELKSQAPAFVKTSRSSTLPANVTVDPPLSLERPVPPNSPVTSSPFLKRDALLSRQSFHKSDDFKTKNFRQDATDSSAFVKPYKAAAVDTTMGTSQSTGRGDNWAGDRGGPFRTYTLPRSGGHRSVSLSGAGAINYRTSAAHPDDLDVNCELLRVNPRFSRSHSLDEGAGLSSWALHHLSVIDTLHGKVTTPANSSTRTSQGTLCPIVPPRPSEPLRIPAPPPSTPKSGTPAYLNEGHYGKIRKTGFAEKHNERWRPMIVNSCQEDTLLNGSPVVRFKSNGSPVTRFKSNGNCRLSDDNLVKTPQNNNSSPVLPSSGGIKPQQTSNGSSALSPSDLQKGTNEPWVWADQEDVSGLTDRHCDPNECSHCQAKNLKSTDEDSQDTAVGRQDDLPYLATRNEKPCEGTSHHPKGDVSVEENVVHVSVSPPDPSNIQSNEDDFETTLKESFDGSNEIRSVRKSEPVLIGGGLSSTPIDGRRHTLPAPRLFGSLSLLSAPVPTFDTSSWETLPPADELDFELEEKPIASSTRTRDPSPGSLSAGSSRSLNSSLSSLSHLSIHPDHSECDSWPSSPVADQALTPDVFLDPCAVQSPKDVTVSKYSDDDKSNVRDLIEVKSVTIGKERASAVHDKKPKEHVRKNEQSKPITGMLHLTPVDTPGGGPIIFSVSIPEEPAKASEQQLSFTDVNSNTNSRDIINSEKQSTQNGFKQNSCAPYSESLCSHSNEVSVEGSSCEKPGKVSCSSQNLSVENDHQGKEKRPPNSADARKPPQRQRSISLTEPPSTLAFSQNKRLVTKSTQSPGSGPLSHFIRAVESHIRGGSSRHTQQPQPPAPLTFSDPCQHLSPSSTPTSTGSSTAPTVVLDAFTQTTPTPTPQSASRASSVTWLSECGCDDLASIEPCASSLALSITEDDYGDDDDDEDDDEEDDWSEGGSLSSSSSPPPTPASMPRDDSSLSLSESLDTLDINGESGIGTVSTRPSVSPPSHAHHTLDLSGSNLSSEDTGLENSFERQIRRYIPNSSSRPAARESDHAQHYRRRRPRPRHHEQWVRREDQMTQTDPHPPTPPHGAAEDSSPSRESILQDSNETLERSRGGSEERMVVRHTHSEPHLDATLTPLGGSLRGVCSEAALPPIPTSHSARSAFTPSAPTLPTLTEDKPPMAPLNSKPPRPRHLSLCSSHPPQHSPGKACSAPVLESKQQNAYTQHTPATTPSEDSSGEAPVLTTRSQSAKEIAELEAIEACKWLRAAGFPQYAQMYEELQFPLDLGCVERDHAFLDRDSLQALFRRLKALNKCAKIRLDSARKNKAEESDDEEQQCALSENWKFQRHNRRWSRIVHDRSPTVGDKTGESRGLEVPEDALLGQFKRSGSERLRDGAKAILRRMESLKNKKKKRQNRDGVVISGPKLVDEAHMQARVAELGCVDISPDASPELSARGTVTTGTPHPRELRQSTPGEDSSSLASDQSQSSTPLFRGRRRRKFWGRGGSAHGVEGSGGGSGGGGGGGGRSI